jgi:nucleotide-binding universal stress UspA family protein
VWLTKKIVVATDFGETSRVAADAAVELAERLRVPLVLVHGHLAPLGAYTPVPVAPSADYVQALEDAVRDLLEEEARRLRGRGVEVTTLLRIGFASEAVLAAAKELDAGLIVMGTHGRRGLPRALLGSVAEKVTRSSPVPVLTVHGGHSASDGSAHS